MVFIHVNETKSKEPLFEKTKYNDAKTRGLYGSATVHSLHIYKQCLDRFSNYSFTH